MAWHTENKAGTFWGSHNLFAAEANCSRDAVRDSVPKLISLGLVEIIGQKPTRNGPCNMYRMNLEVILSLSNQGVEPLGASNTGCSEPDDQVAGASDQVFEACDQVAGAPKNSSLNSSGTRLDNSSEVDRASEQSSADHEQHQEQPRRAAHSVGGPYIPVHSPAAKPKEIPPAPQVDPEERKRLKQAQCSHRDNPFAGSWPDRCRWCGLERDVIEINAGLTTPAKSAWELDD
jgi:hypothetical protein